MNEINIILDSNIELDDNLNVLKNDKKILFDNINKKLNILNLDSNLNFNQDLVDNKLVDIIYTDNFIDFLSELDMTYFNKSNSFEDDILNQLNKDNSNFSKKKMIKKVLEFFNPIIDYSDIVNTTTNTLKQKIIINKNQITLNYKIDAKYVNKKISKLKFKNYIIPQLNNFTILGIYTPSSLQYNIPYNLNEISLELNNNFKLLINSNSNNIFIKDLKYLNKSIFSFESIDIINLIKLYKSALLKFELYNNNIEIIFINNTPLSRICFDINQELIKDNTQYLSLIQNNVIEDKFNIDKFNNFLKHKIGNEFNNNIYNSFNNDNLLNLYEQIRIYSLDNNKIQQLIKNILDQKKFHKEYQDNLLILKNKILINNKLEYIAKKKFPNLFNVNSKENVFNKFNLFDINKVSKKIKDIILLDLKKNENYIQNHLYNKCKHKEVLTLFYNSQNNPIGLYKKFQDLLKYIKKDSISSNNDMYKCTVCSFNIICPHIIEYYILFFKKSLTSKNTQINQNDDYIHQKILNKYMTKAPIDMIYYCKICGEELGKSYDLEQNIEYKDNQKINTLEYSDDTSISIQNTVSYIVYTYISFKGIGIKINKQQIIKYVIDNISFYINNIEKKLRKGKNYDIQKSTNILNFNIIVFTYACLIFIMNKYNNLIFNTSASSKKSKTINDTSLFIVQKNNNIDPIKTEILGSKSINTSNIKENFREAYALIINTNYLLLSKLDYHKNSDIVKNILVKTYTFINNSNELELDTKKTNNLELLFNSSIYKYYFNIKNYYPLSKINNTSPDYKIKNLGLTLNYPDKYSINTLLEKKTKYEDYKNILNNVDLDKKPEYLFENINIPVFMLNNKLESIENLKIINNFNEYKYYSLLLFLYFINNRIYELPIFEFIGLNEDKNIRNSFSISFDKVKDNINENFIQYKNTMLTYIQKSLILKQFELQLINNNIIFNLYPYSYIKSNNIRYFYHKDIKLNKYICKIDGALHNYNIYIYNLNDKEYTINKKNLDSEFNTITNKNTKFIDFQCSKCKLIKNKIDNEYNNDDIYKLINNKNNIVQFYNIYRYKCPLNDFHIFDNDYKCKICKISSEDILTENITIFNKFKTQYNDYFDKLLSLRNTQLTGHLNKNNNLIKLDIKNNYKNEISNSMDITNSFIKYIDDLNIDDLFLYLSKIANIDIKYFKILGLTEGINYEDIRLIDPSFINIDNRFIKITNYIRTLSIYSNLLQNLDKITTYYDYDFLEIINEIKLTGIKNEIKLNNEINLIDIFKFIKIKTPSTNNKYIIEFGLKILFNKIKEIYLLNEKLNNKLNKYIDFVINKIFKFDELFTSFNYAQLKQMFSENSATYDNFYENDEDNEDDGEDDGLFSYNNVDIEFGDNED